MSDRFPFSASVIAADREDTPDRDATARPSASSPDTDQPPCPAVPCARTGSLNSTRIRSSETAVAPDTAGAWPSVSPWLNDAVPSGLLRSSRTDAAVILTEPVAFGGASAGVNEIVWVSAPGLPPPARPVTVRCTPATSSDV